MTTGIDLAAHRAGLYRFARRLVGDPQQADDIVQETMLRALTSSASFNGRSKPLTWLSAIALNVLRDRQRRPAHRREVELDDAAWAEIPDDGTDVVQELMQEKMASCIARFMRELPERQRDAITLFDMAGASHGEVAESLGVSEGNARVLLHRARAAMRQNLSRHCDLGFGRDAIPCSPKEAHGL